MKNVLKLEEAALWLLSILVFAQLEFSWWWYPLLLLLPDISMVGYLSGPRPGAIIYNFWHHRLTALSIFAIGFWSDSQWLMLARCILFGHIAMDRIFGYGLKFSSGFQDTHLGKIGKNGNG